MNKDKLKNIVEGFLFASDKPLTAEQIVKLFPEGEQPEAALVEQSVATLITDFQTHGIELKKVKSGYRFQVKQETAGWVARLWDEKPAKYTRAMLETLALIVYRQPITRGEIEEIRGVSVSSHIIRTMMDRDWVKVIGHRDVPGRPALYASTKEFLDYFNLSSLEDLPPLSEIKDLDSIATELDPEQNAALISAIREMQKDNAAIQQESVVLDNVEDEAQTEIEQETLLRESQDYEQNNEQDSESEIQDSSVSEEAIAQQDLIDEQSSTDTESATDVESDKQEQETPKSFRDLVSKFGKTDQDDVENSEPASDGRKNSVESDAQ